MPNPPFLNNVWSGDVSIVEKTLKKWKEEGNLKNWINHTLDSEGKTPMHIACMSEHATPDMIHLLQKYGANPNKPDYQGKTPLHSAAEAGSSPKIWTLIEAGAALETLTTGANWTPLHMACRSHTSAVKELLNAGANATAKTADGSTCLHISTEYFRSSNAAAITDEGKTLVELLLESGCSPTETNQWGETPIHIATFASNINAMRILVRAGGNINAVNSHGNSPLHLAIKSARWSEANPTDVIKAALALGANPNLPDKQGTTPLQLACRNGSRYASNIVKELLNAGANPMKPDAKGKRPSQNPMAYPDTILPLLLQAESRTLTRAIIKGKHSIGNRKNQKERKKENREIMEL
jgi:ankyrin repeat protein